MRHLAVAIASLTLVAASAQAAEQQRTPPYWASIAASRAKTRTGPARTYPATWLYQRAGLPVKVIGAFKEWRKIEDPDGAQGWMQANLLSSTRTAIVRGSEPVPLRAQAVAGGKLMFRAAPGVVGRVSQCGGGWCRFGVKGRGGFVETSGLWGVEANETLP